MHSLGGLTSQITGGKKQSDEGAALFGVRVDLPCYAFTDYGNLGASEAMYI